MQCMAVSAVDTDTGEPAQGDPLSLFDAADYISDMSEQMAAMARQAGMIEAAAALELARTRVAEALAQARGP